MSESNVSKLILKSKFGALLTDLTQGEHCTVLLKFAHDSCPTW